MTETKIPKKRAPRMPRKQSTFLPCHGALCSLLREQRRRDAADFRVACLVTMLRHRGVAVPGALDTVRHFTENFPSPQAAIIHAVQAILLHLASADPVTREIAWFDLELLCAGLKGLMHRVGGRDLQSLLAKELRTEVLPKLGANGKALVGHLRLVYLR